MNGYYGVGLVFFAIGMLCTLGASGYIKLKYAQTKKILSEKGLTGKDVARRILEANDLSHVNVEIISGELTDHYDPSTKTVRLSSTIGEGNSLASISVASHECGHAIQDKDGYFFLRFRRKMVPFVNLASKGGYLAITIGLISSAFSYFVMIGIILELVILLFHVVTLPVEFNASSRALKQIEALGLVSHKEKSKCRGMLIAAALTYVAAVATSLMEILRLLLIISNRRGD